MAQTFIKSSICQLLFSIATKLLAQLESFERVQQIKPDEPNFWLQKSIVLRALQRPQEVDRFDREAIAVYDKVTANERDNPLLWADRGFVLLQLNR